MREIVIRLENRDYEDIMLMKENHPNALNFYEKIISESQVLPEKHGKLIDADEVKERMGNLDGFGLLGRCIDEFDAVIEGVE